MFTLYSMPSSGNSYKVRLLLAQLGVDYHHVATEFDGGKELTKTDAFRAKNPLGKVPLVEFDGGRLLYESNALLLYFAEGTPFIPDDRFERAKMWQWMFFEQYSHEPCVAVRQSNLKYPHRIGLASEEEMAQLLIDGNRALDTMDIQLNKTPFLAGDAYSAADICLYGYTHSADSGGFDITSRTGISKWLERVRNQPGHVPLDWLPTAP